MSREVSCELTTMCLLSDGDSVLVQDRRDPDWPGIAFPGGHIEPGESVTESAVREFREETGLTINNPRIVGVKSWIRKDNGRYIVFLLASDSYSGELSSSEEGEVFWVKRDVLKSMNLASGYSDLMRVFDDPCVTEMFWRDGGWVYE